jgi:microcystin-dependent protein
MTFQISQLQPNNSTFSDWLNVTNQLANVSSTLMVTVDSADPQVGNVVIDGSIQANTIYATTISGGEIGNTQPLLFDASVVFSSNVAFSGGSTNLGVVNNLLVAGANSTNFILAANTSTGRLRYTAIDSNYINTLNINADRLTAGTVPNGRLDGTYTNLTGTGDLNAGSISTGFGNINIGTNTFTGNGSGLNTLNASNITTGTVSANRLGSGTANNSVFLRGDNSWQNVEAFPSGTKMLFQQTTAPVGWTKVTDASVNNKALRVVTGTAASGGTQDFTAAFATGRTTSSNGDHSHTITVNNHTLTTAQIPAHSHTFSGSTSSNGSHTHTVNLKTPSSGQFGNVIVFEEGAFTDFTSGFFGGINYSIVNSPLTAGGNHTHTFSGTTSSIGSGGAHNHTASSNSTGAHTHTLNLDVAYIDLIIATKN